MYVYVKTSPNLLNTYNLAHVTLQKIADHLRCELGTKFSPTEMPVLLSFCCDLNRGSYKLIKHMRLGEGSMNYILVLATQIQFYTPKSCYVQLLRPKSTTAHPRDFVI